MGVTTSHQQVHQFRTVREAAAQLVMPRVGGEYVARGSAAHEQLLRLAGDLRVGGVIITMAPPLETAARLNMLQEAASLPLLVAADMEHGAGQVLTGGTILPYGFENGGGTRFPPLMGVAATGDEGVARDLGRVTALEARAAGVHVVFAPVVDVNSNPANPIINTRSYGADPAAVARFAAAHVEGLQQHGALAVAKHFPGHGDTSVDSHVDLPFAAADRARLEAVELVPFRAAIAAGVAGVMAGHVAYPRVTGDRTPASLSRPLLTLLLREELGFDGVVFTDALDMGAITRGTGVVEAAIRALEAGADVLVQMPVTHVEAVIDGIAAAVDDGRLPEDRLHASIQRVARARHRLGLHGDARVDLQGLPSVVGAPAHAAAASDAARRSITVIRDDGGMLPLRGGRLLTILYTADHDPFAGRSFQAALEAAVPGSRTVRLDGRSDGERIAEVERLAETASDVVFAALVRVMPGKASLSVAGPVAAMVRRVEARRSLAIVAFGSPYLVDEFPGASTFLLAWGAWDPMQTAAADAVTGRAAVGGRLPVPLPPRHAAGDGLPLQGASR